VSDSSPEGTHDEEASSYDVEEQASAGLVLRRAAWGALGALGPALLGVLYWVARARNRRAAASPRSRAVQEVLATWVERASGESRHGDRVRRVVLRDRTRLTAATLGDIADRVDALEFIRTVRASQPDDFAGSPQFLALPLWAQDSVVLLDLDADVRMNGLVAAVSGGAGFYRHPFERIAGVNVPAVPNS
jgi:hypothetical protein